MPAVHGISSDELHQLCIDDSIVLIDVREIHEFEEERIPGAVNLPLSSLSKEAIAEIAGDKEVVFQCRSGYRSYLVAKEYYNGKLPQKHLDGGILAWSSSGKATLDKAI